MTTLVEPIAMLHKWTQQEAHYRTLLTLRRQLTDLIARKHHRTIQRSKAFFYIHANKGGRLLARMLRNQQASAQVSALRTARGSTTQFPKEIANKFRTYY
ncbi:Hypothetical predicted protein [Pelobates cultripes]|uniref:Uncharacterized protein n=1 Tax=Pelobates cultripes TaxID=61616 RepID=A0AAD1RRH2_PELCU|nr:Hypothetical predicted protein [Pelobates cultripes]